MRAARAWLGFDLKHIPGRCFANMIETFISEFGPLQYSRLGGGVGVWLQGPTVISL